MMILRAYDKTVLSEHNYRLTDYLIEKGLEDEKLYLSLKRIKIVLKKKQEENEDFIDEPSLGDLDYVNESERNSSPSKVSTGSPKKRNSFTLSNNNSSINSRSPLASPGMPTKKSTFFVTTQVNHPHPNQQGNLYSQHSNYSQNSQNSMVYFF